MNAALLRRVILPAWYRAKGEAGFLRLRELEQTQWLSPSELQDLQWSRLGTLLEHAYQHVPYYTDAMDRTGSAPRALVRNRSLASLPLLDRATVREQAQSLRTHHFSPQRYVANTTGGSTGEPLRFLDDREGYGWTTAAVWRAQRWLGIDIGERCAYLWGAELDLNGFASATGRLKSAVLNMLMLPAWALGDERACEFWDQLRAFKPKLLVAYAGAVDRMASLVGPDREAIAGLRAVVVSAELLSERARANIEACFKVPVYNRYGGRDLTFVAQECPDRQGLHINAEHVMVEIVTDGRLAQPGELGEVVLTRLENFAMPFVRYRTGDLAAMAPSPCTCGRSLPLLQRLEGRLQDAIVTPEGRMVSGLLFFHMFKDCPEVRSFQVHQMALDELSINVVLAAGSEFVSRPRVDRIMREFFGAAMRVTFDVRDDIPLTRAGKRRIVVSHLSA